MARRVLKSLGTGLSAAFLFAVVWFFGLERVIVTAHEVPVAARPSHIGPTPPDGIVVADEVVSESTIDDPYVVPLTVGMFEVVSIWTFRRLRANG